MQVPRSLHEQVRRPRCWQRNSQTLISSLELRERRWRTSARDCAVNAQRHLRYSITNPVVRLEAYEQTSRERHVHVGPVEHHEHELRVLVRQCTKSSRVPDPTVDRHLSVNSGAERMGATTMCLAMCVMTVRGNPRKQQNMSCECVLKIACLGEGSSSKPKATRSARRPARRRRPPAQRPKAPQPAQARRETPRSRRVVLHNVTGDATRRCWRCERQGGQGRRGSESSPPDRPS